MYNYDVLFGMRSFESQTIVVGQVNTKYEKQINRRG